MRSAGEATRERILDAAQAEFARHGIAGARINRIAAEAKASKERLYAYFAGKEELFAAVSERWVAATTAHTALRGDDLPGYAGRLFDEFVAFPEHVRLQRWADLEESHRPRGDSRAAAISAKIGHIRAGQRDGHIDDSWDSVELLMVVTDVVMSFAVGHYGAGDRRRPDTARRAAAVEAVRRLAAPRG